MFWSFQPLKDNKPNKKRPKPREKSPIWHRIMQIATRARAGTGNKLQASRVQRLTHPKWRSKILDIGSKRFADGVDSIPSKTHTLHQAQAERVAQSIAATTRKKMDTMFENFRHVEGWEQYEILELLKQGVDLAEVSIPWLDLFREDLDLRV